MIWEICKNTWWMVRWLENVILRLRCWKKLYFYSNERSLMREKVIVLLSTFVSTVLKIKSKGTLRRKYRAKPKYTISFPTVGTLICKHFARATPMSHNLIVNSEPVSTESWRIQCRSSSRRNTCETMRFETADIFTSPPPASCLFAPRMEAPSVGDIKSCRVN